MIRAPALPSHPQVRTGEKLMSTKGHVWTAPWQELFDVAAALVGCGHVSGLFVRHVAAGPNALRGSGPNQKHKI